MSSLIHFQTPPPLTAPITTLVTSDPMLTVRRQKPASDLNEGRDIIAAVQTDRNLLLYFGPEEEKCTKGRAARFQQQDAQAAANNLSRSEDAKTKKKLGQILCNEKSTGAVLCFLVIPHASMQHAQHFHARLFSTR